MGGRPEQPELNHLQRFQSDIRNQLLSSIYGVSSFRGTIRQSPRYILMAPGAFAPVHLAWIDVLARFGAALILSLALGLERFLHRKPVDFRPFVIISLASCSLTIAIMEVAVRADDHQLSIDPAKVMSGIMTGIGFLGAGALFRERHIVQGAGSAAAIWAAGAIGMVAGFGLLWLAGILGIAVVGTLMVSRSFVGDYVESKRQQDGATADD